MPMNLKGRMVKKCQQADVHMRRAQWFIAQTRATVVAEHPDLAPALDDVLQTIDHARHNLTVFVRGTFSRTTYKRYTRKRLAGLLRRAKSMKRQGID